MIFLSPALINAQNPEPSGTARMTLGQSAVPLYGPWKFTVGDSPIDPKTGKPLWAEPDFDDSHWENLDLNPKQQTTDPRSGLSDDVPGWTARGHTDYWGYAWYRIRVQVQMRPGQQLALEGPVDVDDVYQAFANGELAGQFGDFRTSHPKVFFTQPVMFLLPPERVDSTTNERDSASIVLAFRLWMEPLTLFQGDVGGFHTAPTLGEAETIRDAYIVRWVEQVRRFSIPAFQAFLFALFSVMGFSLLLFDRSDTVYAWMGALFLLIAAGHTLDSLEYWSQVLSVTTYFLLSAGLGAMSSAAWAIVWWVWFGCQDKWIPRTVTALTLLLMVSEILGEELFLGLIPHTLAVRFYYVGLLLEFFLFAILVWIVAQGIRRQGLEGWLVLPVVILIWAGSLSTLMSLHVNVIYHVFGVKVTFPDIAELLIPVVIAILLLRRLWQSVKRQREMALDVKQAQEVQQVILPEARLALPGLTIESEYRPAREVGGDFFQIIPNQIDGSVLIVAGDVTGKGLKAGMLVALLVGAIRTEEKHGTDPAGMLRTLNQRLMGRGDAQATCLSLKIEANGAVTLANAGHVAPYLNGEELPIEGALPLGLVESAEPSVMQFQLKPNDRLMLLSDGVAEATDVNGELFGFERVHELLRTARSAAGIAGAAQAFGQEDDISVISVTRALPEPA
jgi:hypothetical protein